LRLRSHGRQPPYRQPRAAARPGPIRPGRAYAPVFARRRHGPDRRPERQGQGTPTAHRGDGRRLGRAHQGPGHGLFRAPGRGGSGHAGQQPRLDEGTVHHRIPARHRQAFHHQLHAGQGFGEVAHRPGRDRHLLYRIQLHDPAGLRFLPPAHDARLHAADRRRGSVRQHHGRPGADSPQGRGRGVRPDLSADHHRLGRQVRQERKGRHLS